MDWFTIILLSSPSLILGLLSLKGVTQGKELILWFSLGFLCVLYIYLFIPGHPFFHLFLIGLFWGVINSSIQTFFYPVFLANNPKAAESYSKISKKLNPRVVMMLIGIGTGVGAGLLFGSISWITKIVIF